MSRIRTTLTGLLFFSAFSTLFAGDDLPGPTPKEWVKKAPKKFGWQDKYLLPENRYYEVRVTRLLTAVLRLKDSPILDLNKDEVAYYLGSAFKVEKNLHPYLVRGLFSNYTGAFRIFLKDNEVYILHCSLGTSSEPSFCPLVLMLSEKPKKIFVEVSVIK